MVDPRALVRPLEARWQDVLDRVLRAVTGTGGARGPLSTKDVARLAPKVQELSHAYNTAAAEGRRTKLPLEARIAFSFPRDVPKGAGAVRELVASGALAIPADRPLRVLDLGAGLGAMTWGLARALAASGARGRIEAMLVDEDEQALKQAEAIARAARSTFGAEPVELAMTTHVASVAARPDQAASRIAWNPSSRQYDVVILGQVLSELDPRAAADDRLARQADLVAALLDSALAADGALVIVEPALRERTRHLHALRDRVLARAAPRATVFAPCLHAAPCPVLAVEHEWCHEHLRVDLPDWVAPLARAAGLRWQGLTFSYLVLRKDGRLPAPRLDPDDRRIRFRVVSDVLRTKGKTEIFTCSESGERSKIRRLDRDAAAGGAPFDTLERGDIVTLGVASAPPASPVDERGRVHAEAEAIVELGPSPT